MSIEQHAYDLLIQLYMLLDDGDRQILAQFDLTVPRFYLLVHLGKTPGLSPHQLSEAMFCDKSNITRLAQNLLKRGLIEKRPHETDGRSFRLYLTAEGEQLRQKAVTTHQAFNGKRLGAMPAKLPELLTLLNEVRDSLNQEIHGTV